MAPITVSTSMDPPPEYTETPSTVNQSSSSFRHRHRNSSFNHHHHHHHHQRHRNDRRPFTTRLSRQFLLFQRQRTNENVPQQSLQQSLMMFDHRHNRSLLRSRSPRNLRSVLNLRLSSTTALPNLSPSSSSTTTNTTSTTIARSERNPFLIMKILLFSLMTIDFVMNTIGLAVIIVIVKNHYNNFILERSFLMKSDQNSKENYRTPNFQIQSPFNLDVQSSSSSSSDYSDFLDPFNSQNYYQSEWSLLLPLLPSFIFAEILTLIGMFGVFCDQFSFTMTYAILKLITSLCFPSMASMAAVTAMASATSNPNSVISSNSFPSINVSSLGYGFSNDSVSNVPMKLILVKNLTYPSTMIAEKTKIDPQLKWNDERKLMKNQFVDDTIVNNIMAKTTLMPSLRKLSNVSDRDQQTESSMITTTPNPVIVSSLSTEKIIKKMSTQLDPIEQRIHHNDNKHSFDVDWLKNYETNKDFRQSKKSDRLARLKARERQLLNRFIKLGSLDQQDQQNQQLNFNNQLRSSTTIISANRDPSTKQSVYDSFVPLSSSPSSSSLNDDLRSKSSALLPLEIVTHFDANNQHQQHHHINHGQSSAKYHHRVWAALLVTFEVIFAVSFAFNLLSQKSINEATDIESMLENFDEDEIDNSRRRRRPFRNPLLHHHHNRNLYSSRGVSSQSTSTMSSSAYWPYSPSVTSIDAFYFAYFRFPPPPPPYFCSRNLASDPIRRSPSATIDNNQLTRSPSNNRNVAIVRNNHRRLLSRALFHSNGFRRLTPSWLLDRRNNNRQHHLQRPNNIRITDNNNSILPPPQYEEEIGRDHHHHHHHHHQHQRLEFNAIRTQESNELSATDQQRQSAASIDDGQRQQAKQSSSTSSSTTSTSSNEQFVLKVINQASDVADDVSSKNESNSLSEMSHSVSTEVQNDRSNLDRDNDGNDRDRIVSDRNDHNDRDSNKTQILPTNIKVVKNGDDDDDDDDLAIVNDNNEDNGERKSQHYRMDSDPESYREHRENSIEIKNKDLPRNDDDVGEKCGQQNDCISIDKEVHLADQVHQHHQHDNNHHHHHHHHQYRNRNCIKVVINNENVIDTAV